MMRCKKTIPALFVAASLLQWTVMAAAYGSEKDGRRQPQVTAQPNVSRYEARYFIDPAKEPRVSRAALVKLLRKRIKYVFVIFNENHSFDNEYGTFPGVNGIYSDGLKPRSAARTPGFTQTYRDNLSGATVVVHPFRLGPGQNSSVMDSVDHSNEGMIAKYDVACGAPRMDGYARREYQRFAGAPGVRPTAAGQEEGTQFARLVMSHIDCDTIPFFWQYARRFTIFDNIFATEDGPSTPNAIAMISGQVGQTQWVKHPVSAGGEPETVGKNSGTLHGPPITGDSQPFYGSQFDTARVDREPAGTREHYKNGNITMNLTFATLPLTFQGKDIVKAMGGNLNPGLDLPDIQQDIPYIRNLGKEPVNWGWYQEGYDHEASDPPGVASHNSYVSHHNAAQYFGYIADTPAVRAGMHGLTDFFNALAKNSLPEGGVFYIRGGYLNLIGKKPVVTDPKTSAGEIAAIDAAKAGDDDHPAYSDRQLTEAMAARVINAVASSPKIWSRCAIIITYDETDGEWDHVPPRILAYGPKGLLSRGSRVPLILISPYARTHVVSHVEGDHNSVIETINYIFGLPALASLPDEAQALKKGDSRYFNRFAPAGFHQKHLGPNDIESQVSNSLLSGFSPRRLSGKARPLPASFALIPETVVNTFPHYGGHGCKEIGIVPEDVRQGIENNIPEGFNPLPGTYPATAHTDAVTY
ncbi:MAG: alkaline phosphatase family protein [Syntrophobacteraceae bacterium]|nr:alkaline phosphatase family protein [Syntrophobacteraceae bacterium]